MNKSEAAKAVPGVTVVVNQRYRGTYAYGVFEEYIPPAPAKGRYDRSSGSSIRWRPLTTTAYDRVMVDGGEEIVEREVPLQLSERCNVDSAAAMYVINGKTIEQIIEERLAGEQRQADLAAALAAATERLEAAVERHGISKYFVSIRGASYIDDANKLAEILEQAQP